MTARARVRLAVAAVAVAGLLAAPGRAIGQTPAPAAPPATAPTPVEAAAATPTVPTPTPSPHDPAFAAWLDTLRADAVAAGIKPATIDAAFATIVAQPVVLERDRSQAEFTLTLGQYVDRRLTPALLRLAREHARRQQGLLARIERAHKVPSSILVAVWGLESNFGRFAGVRPTVPALATLAYDGRRAALFRGELLNALRILDRGDIELDRLKGSWAGAMGQPQFMPSSYLKFAQDFDGDGRRDIWTSLPDVLASIANYMASNGWVDGESWGRRVKLPPDLDARLGSKAPLRTEGCRAVAPAHRADAAERVAGGGRPHGEGHAAAEGGDRRVPAARRPGDVPRLPQLRDAADLQLRALLRHRRGAARRSPRRPARELARREEGGQAGAHPQAHAGKKPLAKKPLPKKPKKP